MAFLNVFRRKIKFQVSRFLDPLIEDLKEKRGITSCRESRNANPEGWDCKGWGAPEDARAEFFPCFFFGAPPWKTQLFG